MTQTIKPNRFRTQQKPQQVEEVVDDIEVVEDEVIEEQEVVELVSKPSIRKPKNIIQEETIEEKQEQVTSVVKPVGSVPKKPGFFKRKVERVQKEVEETNVITGKDSLEALAKMYAEYLESLEDETEDGRLVKDIIDPNLSLLFLDTFQEMFTTKIFPNYNKVEFLGSLFEKKESTTHYRKFAPAKIKTDGMGYMYYESDTKVKFEHTLPSDSLLKVYFFTDEDDEIIKIQKVENKKAVDVVDNSLDYLIPGLEKYIESQSKGV